MEVQHVEGRPQLLPILKLHLWGGLCHSLQKSHQVMCAINRQPQPAQHVIKMTFVAEHQPSSAAAVTAAVGSRSGGGGGDDRCGSSMNG